MRGGETSDAGFATTSLMGFRRLGTRSRPSRGANCPSGEPRCGAGTGRRAGEVGIPGRALGRKPCALDSSATRSGTGSHPAGFPRGCRAGDQRGRGRLGAHSGAAGGEGRLPGVRLVTGRSIDISRGPGGPGPGARGGGLSQQGGVDVSLTASGFVSLWPLQRWTAKSSFSGLLLLLYN